MIVDYQYVDLYIKKLGIDPYQKFEREDAAMFMEERSLKCWDYFCEHYPDFFEIMNTSGNLFVYLVRHGKTIELVQEIGISARMENVMYGLLKQEYITSNLFDIHYFQQIINCNKDKFSKPFLEILYNEHSLVYKKLDEHFEESFPNQACLYSRAIEKSMLLCQEKINLLKESEEAGISQYQAQEESRIYINERINTYKL